MTIRFNELLKEIHACRLCASSLTDGCNPILRASQSARILVAGQAPGRKVHETSIPFNDPSGDRLRAWMGIDKKIFYDDKLIALIPMGLCYPGKGLSGDLPPRKECAQTWHPKLIAQLNNVEMILSIGLYSHHYYFDNQLSVTQRVLSWKKFFPKIIPLPHPSPRNNLWLSRNPWFEQELIPILRSQIKQILSDK